MICFQFVGLPGSGKTFIRNKVIADFKLKLDDVVIASIDDFVHQIRGDQSYGEAFRDNVEEASAYVSEQFSTAYRHGLPLIVDKTNLTRNHRLSNWRALPQHKHIAIVARCPVEVRRGRLKRRSEQIVPADVLEGMERKYQEPDILEEPHLHAVVHYNCA